MRKPIVKYLSLLLLLAGPVLADDAEALRQRLAGLESLKANFSQQVTDVNQKQIQQGEGVLALGFPNRFYWHLTEPDESLIVAAKETVWIYNPFAEEVTALDMADVLEASPMALLVQQDKASWDKYDIKAKGDCYAISPKDKTQSAVVDVTVCFKGEVLSSLSLTDEQHNLSHFELSGVTKLSDTDSTLFQFDLPQSVTLDDQRKGFAK
ncbi:outer membrane lipoprotein chaperone LolA [Shewanella cyperi]|uniref:outer membrane lipoprotein chaperone LolA n=1 Tax=Shewanella cyperi TaxID=2814292 RepID=UPI001D1935DA